MSSSLLSLYLSFFLLFSTVTAFNITQILSNQSDFSTFNDLLTRTQLASQINTRQTITVFAVENGQITSLSSQPMDKIKKLLSMHVILDYFDFAKLQQLPNKTTTLTTLYQASGQAGSQEGFLNVTDKDGRVLIGSTSKGSSINSSLVRSVYALPYNISVLQVSAPIIPGAASNSTSSAPSLPPSSPPSPAPLPDDVAPTPSNSSDAPSLSPSSAPANSMPPAADSPASSPPGTAGPSPGNSPPANAAGSTAIGGTGIWIAMGCAVFSSVRIRVKMM